MDPIYERVIPLPPITKKNSQRILFNKGTGRPFIAPSKAYKDYEAAALRYLGPLPPEPIDRPVNVMCVFGLPTRRRTDLNNLLEAATDLLVKGASWQTTIIASSPGTMGAAASCRGPSRTPSSGSRRWRWTMSLRIVDMRDTVAAYARSDMRMSRAAKELHLSRRAVEERVRRIHKETGRDPRRFFDLVALLERWKNIGQEDTK